MAKKVKSVIALLKANGWVFVRMRGDHRVFKKKDLDTTSPFQVILISI